MARSRSLLNDRNHGVLLATLTLIEEICRQNPEHIAAYRKIAPTVVRLLRSLMEVGFSPEHDVSGLCDPFLQTRLLRLLRTLGRDDADASDAMSDILAHVITNTDASKNVGNAVLYEAVQTVMEIRAETGLRVLAINILGRFLANKDNNIRYVALNALTRSLASDHGTVQRHRATIVECLHDQDVSIKRRAMELTVALINETNALGMVRELLTALADESNIEFKPYLSTQICLAAEKFHFSRQWQIETILRVLVVAGNHVREESLATFQRLIAESPPEIQTLATRLLFDALRRELNQQALVIVGVWALGEYGDFLVVPPMTAGKNVADAPMAEADVVALVETVLQACSSDKSSVVVNYCLTALLKLASRFSRVLE